MFADTFHIEYSSDGVSTNVILDKLIIQSNTPMHQFCFQIMHALPLAHNAQHSTSNRSHYFRLWSLVKAVFSSVYAQRLSHVHF